MIVTRMMMAMMVNVMRMMTMVIMVNVMRILQGKTTLDAFSANMEMDKVM